MAVDSATRAADWSTLQNNLRDIQNKAGATANVEQPEIQKLQEAIDSYASKYGIDQKQVDAMKNALSSKSPGSMAAIIGEDKKDKSNDLKWQQASTAVDELLRNMAPGSDTTSAANMALKDDYDFTILPDLGITADATTAGRLQNFIDAHPGLPKEFVTSANAMITKLKADPKSVQSNDLRALGATVTGKTTTTPAAGSADKSASAAGTTAATSTTSLPAGITANVPVSAADKAKLPGLLKDTTNQVMPLDTVPPTYMEMDNNTYALYDNTGNTRMQEFGKDKDFALGLGNNKWFVSNDNDLSKAKFIKEPSEDPKAATRNAYTFSNATNATTGAVTDTKSTLANYGKTTGDGTIKPNQTTASSSEPINGDKKESGGYHAYAGAKGSDGKSVFADVWSQSIDGLGSNHDTRLKDGDGKNITPDSLKTGQYGIFNFANGAQYVSMDPTPFKPTDGSKPPYSGYFMVTGDEAKDVLTGNTIKADKLNDAIKGKDLKVTNESDNYSVDSKPKSLTYVQQQELVEKGSVTVDGVRVTDTSLVTEAELKKIVATATPVSVSNQ